MLLKSALITLWGFSTAFLTDEEVDVLLASLKHLKIRKCILSFETDLNVTYVKKLNLNYVMAGHMTPEMLEEYVTEMNPPDAAIAVVTKDKSYVKNLFSKKYESLNWFIWFLVTGDDLDDVDIPITCQFFHVKRGSDGNYRLTESYTLEDIFVNDNFGIWSPGKGLNASSLGFHERRKNFRGIEVNVTLCKQYKVSVSLLQFFEDTARALNFTILKESKYENEEIVSEKYKTIHDITTCIWAITGLETAKDWVFLHSGLKVGLLTKFRGTNDIGWGAYVTPFAKDMWLAIFLWLLISTAALIIVRGCRGFEVYASILTAFFCLCNNDPMATHPPNEPLSLSTALVYLMLLIVPCIIVPAYSGYILSTLSCVLPLTPFVDLKSFIADGSFALTAPDNSFGSRFMRKSPDPDVRFISENLFKRTSRSYEEMFENLCKDSRLAGLFPNSKAVYSLFKCKMYIMPNRVISISTGTLLPNGSVFRKFFNKRFRLHSERGLKYNHYRSSFFVKNKFEEETDSLSSLDMSQMKVIFLLLIIGAVLSLTVLIIEMGVKKRSQNTGKTLAAINSVNLHKENPRAGNGISVSKVGRF